MKTLITSLLVCAALGAAPFGARVLAQDAPIDWSGQYTLKTPPAFQGYDAQATDWTGTYAVEGSSPTGTYKATMAILRHGEAYEVQWKFPNGDGMIGLGFVYNADLVVGYSDGRPGVIVYHVVERTPLTLVGRYVGWGFETVSPERAVKGPPAIRASR